MLKDLSDDQFFALIFTSEDQLGTEYVDNKGVKSTLDSCGLPAWQNDTGMLDPEMIEDTAKIVNEAQKDKVQVNLIINNRPRGNAPLIALKIPSWPHSEKQHRL